MVGRADAQGGRVILGGTVSLSGRFADFGEPARRDLGLWAREVNASGGLGGSPVALHLEDDQSDPERARDRFEALAPEADLLIAPYGSWLTEAVLPVVERAGRPCIAPSAGGRRLWERERRAWTVQLLNPVDTMLHSLVDLAVEAGLASVAFLYRTDPFSTAVMRGAIARARGRALVIQGILAYEDASELASADGRLAAFAAADLVVGMGFQPGGREGGFLDDALLQLDLVRRAGLSPRALCLGVGAAGLAFGRAAGAGAEGVLGSTGWRDYVPTPGNRAFVEGYRARWGGAPDAHAAQAYAAGQLFHTAWVRAAQALGTRPVPGAVRDALFALRTETVFGRYAVDPRGIQTAKENAVVQWQDGRPVVVGPARYRTGSFRLTR